MNKQLCQLFSGLFFSVFFVATSVHADIQLRFGVYTSDKPTTMVKMFRPVLNALELHLSNKLGEKVAISLQVASTYDIGVDDLVSGRVDFARMGPASYILSQQRNPKIRLLAIESKKGNKVFFGIICIHENSPLNRVEEIRGHSFTFGDEHSTIGRYLSQDLLLEHGITAKDLRSYQYLNRHDRVGTAVGNGLYDAGALKESTFKRLREKGVAIRELSRFPNVTKPWIANHKLNDRITSALTEALLELQDPIVLKGLGISGFLATHDEDFVSIRKAIDRNPAFFQ